MKIFGIQKLSLLDYPGRVACTLFTGGCNLRCPFCHNASLVISPDGSDAMSEDEVLAFLKKRSGILDGVCISGGEPLLQKDIAEFIRVLRSMGYSVKLDTNGCFPDELEKIVGEGLVDYVAMDIKNSPEKYPITVGVPDFDVAVVMRSAEYIMKSGVDYEFRTTVVKGLHQTQDFIDIASWLSGAKRMFLQSFTDSGDLIDGGGLSAYSRQELEKFAEILSGSVQSVALRGI
ncbi:MAG: anaerobic ribonucleoside-triphosphate reductase activating protein [Clostridiales bacterium]|nr:anaerobic ribonucleoside-triphosphate reductase activating protein [Clostridiales bacterium]